MPKIALAQINPVLGDIRNNANRMRAAFRDAAALGAEIVVFPQRALSGAPPGGLVKDRDFRARGREAEHSLAAEFSGRAVMMEFFGHSGNPSLPYCGERLRLLPEALPYSRGLPSRRLRSAAREAAQHNVWIAECALVGGQDDTLYAGGSFVVGPDGTAARAKLFQEDLFVFELVETPGGYGLKMDGRNEPEPEETAEIYEALVMAIRDYVGKNSLPGVIFGLSGGIDSALVAALAVEALGPEKVRCLTMPSPFTSAETLADAKRLAANLGIRLDEKPIRRCFQTLCEELGDLLTEGRPDPEDLAGQNIQARLRAILLMAVANRNGLVLLNCSNKSEGSVGYGTLYGDLAGGYSPLKDVWKTEVWDLARHANRRAGRELIPETIIDRVPTAELRHNQEDRQSIPDYPVLDKAMGCFRDEGTGYAGMLGKGLAEADCRKVLSLHYASEFKRRQSPLGPFVSANHGDRLPVSHKYRPWES